MSRQQALILGIINVRTQKSSYHSPATRAPFLNNMQYFLFQMEEQAPPKPLPFLTRDQVRCRLFASFGEMLGSRYSALFRVTRIVVQREQAIELLPGHRELP